jgi:multidrug efflux pump subunit AcrB
MTQVRLRIDAPDGTRVAVTEDMVKRVLASIRDVAGDKNLDLSLGYVGTQGSSYPINAVFLWTSGPQQAIINVGLKQDSSLKLADLEEQLRKKLPQQFPDVHFSFDPGDLVSQTLSFGSSSLAEVTITGPQYADVASYAERVRQKLAAIPQLRDLEYEEPQHYPTVDIHVNRAMAGQLGTTADAVGSAVVSATASSRFVAPSYWRDPKSGVSYQVQVQVPQPKMTSLGDIGNIPVGSTTGAQPLVNQLADLRSSTVPGELDRQNGQWMLALSANLAGRDLRLANKSVEKALGDAGAPPRGVKTEIRGQVSALQQIFGELAMWRLLESSFCSLRPISNLSSSLSSFFLPLRPCLQGRCLCC